MTEIQWQQLDRLGIRDLRSKYQELFGEQSRSSNKQYLVRRIAWRMQAASAGGLSERARARIAEIADDADLRTRAPKGFVERAAWASGRSGRDWRIPSAGTVLTRKINGRQIVVKVLRDGFEYDARHYKSLSAIARDVTGTRWNGLLFFGLAERV
jgi:hypothetical protein